MSNLGEVTRDTFDEMVGSVSGPIFIDVWGPECQPCLALAPTYESLAEKHGEDHFLKLLAKTNRMLCANLRVLSLPTFLYFEDGEEKDRLTGEPSAQELIDWVEASMSQKEVSA